MSSQDPIEISCEFRHQTEDAVLIYDGTQEVWLPKSMLIEDIGEPATGENIEIIIPEWLAEKKELI